MVRLFYAYSPAIMGSVTAAGLITLYAVTTFIRFEYPEYVLVSWGICLLLFILGSIITGKLIHKLYLLSNIDSLTGLWNRRYFNTRLQEELRRIQGTNNSFAFALIDIDYFKEVNDLYGHAVGDELLITIAGLLKGAIGRSAVITRWGGDEFAIIIRDVAVGDARNISESLKSIVCGHKQCQSRSISVGVIVVQEQIEKEQIIVMADKELYEDKKKKRLARTCTIHA
ncbi:hypothetical protein P22_3467 [Propionispora sp. 2/2-37]|uniref:GGDEF domain-containing protein n=1 Tax=Propionispora sp. 2/2-37 TaxID=1677858 RepID=UPI0006BB57FF|nr:GGDEF domain-containing protein [Propionispora sp. 2/2-37]CUH97340.1 hypothetical protein P22_3467 [Propionispora sp. 2/2-37]